MSTVSILLGTLQLTLVGRVLGYMAKKMTKRLSYSVLRDSRELFN